MWLFCKNLRLIFFERAGMIAWRFVTAGGEKEMKRKKPILWAAAALMCLMSPAAFAAGEELVPVGRAVGIVLDVEGVIVEELDTFQGESGRVSPAKDAGILKGDVLLALDGEKVTGTEELNALLAEKGAGDAEVTILRAGREMTLGITPALDTASGQVRLGVLATEEISGIGTVTYYDPATGCYGALGHGIHAGKSGDSCLDGGELFDVTLSEVRKGTRGEAGELRGSIVGESVGTAEKNTPFGVFGRADEALFQGETLETAERGEVHPGHAEILSEVAEGECGRYAIEILRVGEEEDTAKSISFRVKDKALLEKTGGVVRGMSGSPIVQDGKLVGAVTHVLISDPREGYGILIGDMLKAAA